MSKRGNYKAVHTVLERNFFNYTSKSGDDANDGSTPELAKASPIFTYYGHNLIGAGIYYGGNISLYYKTLEGIGNVVFDGSLLADGATIIASDVQGTQGAVKNITFRNASGTKSLSPNAYASTFRKCRFKEIRLYSGNYFKNFQNCVFENCEIDQGNTPANLNLGTSNCMKNNTYFRSDLIIRDIASTYSYYSGYRIENSYFDESCRIILPDSFFDNDPNTKQFTFINCSINCPIYSYSGGNYTLQYNTILEYVEFLIGIGTPASRIQNLTILQPYSNPDNTLSQSSPFIGAGIDGAYDIGAYAQAEFLGALFPSDNYLYKDNIINDAGGIEFDASNLGFALKAGITKDNLKTLVRDDLKISTYAKNHLYSDGETATDRINISPEYNTIADFVIRLDSNTLSGVVFNIKLDDGDLTVDEFLKNDVYVYTERIETITEGVDFNLGADVAATLVNLKAAVDAITGLSSWIDGDYLHVAAETLPEYTISDYDIIDLATIILEIEETSANANLAILDCLGTNPNLDTYEARYSPTAFTPNESEATLPFFEFLFGYEPQICKRGLGANERTFGNGNRQGYFNVALAQSVTYRYIQERYTLTSANVEA